MSRWVSNRRRAAWCAAVGGTLVFGAVAAVAAQDTPPPTDTTPRIKFYGSGQGDLITDFQRGDPNWFDANRPSKLPSDAVEFGRNGHTYVGARQSSFGASGTLLTRRGDVFANVDFDMSGVGRDAGQTTFHLRHAYGKWHGFGGGQLESAFMDVDVFPKILDSWGPNGMVYLRNAQLFWEPINHGATNLRVALEMPGASADAGNFADRIDLQHVTPRYPLPDLSAGYKVGGSWGYVRIGALLRDIRWDQTTVDTIDLSGHVTAWGTNVSSNINFLGQDIIRLQVAYGEGVENYFNDAPTDVGAEFNTSNRRTLNGEALPIFGAVAFIDHYWNPRVTTSLGWSMVNIDNSDAQAGSAFHNGQYGIVNLLWTPVTNVIMGIEYQRAKRTNGGDGFTFNDNRVQISFRYSFSQQIGGK